LLQYRTFKLHTSSIMSSFPMRNAHWAIRGVPLVARREGLPLHSVLQILSASHLLLYSTPPRWISFSRLRMSRVNFTSLLFMLSICRRCVATAACSVLSSFRVFYQRVPRFPALPNGRRLLIGQMGLGTITAQIGNFVQSIHLFPGRFKAMWISRKFSSTVWRFLTAYHFDRMNLSC
jgi:hypothetical protein